MGKPSQVIKIEEALQKGDQETSVKLLKDLKRRAKDPAVVKFAEDKLKELGVRDSDNVKTAPSGKTPGVQATQKGLKVQSPPQENLPGETTQRRKPELQSREGPEIPRTGSSAVRPYRRRSQDFSRKPFARKPGSEMGNQKSAVRGREDLKPEKSAEREDRKPGTVPGPPRRPFLRSSTRTPGAPPQKKPFRKKPRFKRKPLTPEEMARKEAARNLVNEHKISFTAAYKIVDGELTLEEYRVKQEELAAKRAAWLEKQRAREERKAKAFKLAEEHNLNASITYQIVDGRFTLEEYLKLQELKPKKLLVRRRKEGVGAWYFQQLRQNQVPLVFVLYNGETLVSPLTDIEKYDFQLGEQKIPKLHITYFYEAKQAERIKELIPVNEEVKAKNLVPALKPTDRYLILDKDLERCREGKSLVTFTTLGGDIVQGTIEWVDSFQLKLNLQEDMWVVLFRHGIQEAVLPEGVTEAPDQALLQPEKTSIEIPIEKISVELAIHQNARLNPQLTGKVREQTKTLGKIPRPIWVAYDRERDVYILLDGYRRLTIAQELGLTTLPAVVE